MKAFFSVEIMVSYIVLLALVNGVSTLPTPLMSGVDRRDTTSVFIPGPQNGNVIRIRDNTKNTLEGGMPAAPSLIRRGNLATESTTKTDEVVIRPVGAAVAQKLGSSVANLAKTAVASVSKAYNTAANAFGNAQELTKEVVKKAGSNLIDTAQSGISKLLGTSEEKKA